MRHVEGGPDELMRLLLPVPSAKVQILTQKAVAGLVTRHFEGGPDELMRPPSLRAASAAGAQFTCFNCTKVQIMNDELMRPPFLRAASAAGAQFTCFTSTKVQIMTDELMRPPSLRCRCSIYLLY